MAATTSTATSAGTSNTTGGDNTFSGYQTGYFNTTGAENTFFGFSAGQSNTTGSNNTFSGFAAGFSNTTGNQNTFYGNLAGYWNWTGSYDVYIGSVGVNVLPGAESNTIRIGMPYSTGFQACNPLSPPCGQTTAYIAGIYGSTTDNNGIPVYVDDNGQLGTVVSSRRFKEQIRNMGDSTTALMKLRPVTFFYKPEYDKGPRTLQYGLIAEEVAEVYPELVAYDKDGQPYTVRYQYLATMLLNEVQKQYRRAEAEAEVIQTQQDQLKAQERKIGDLERRLSKLESLVGSPVKTAARN